MWFDWNIGTPERTTVLYQKCFLFFQIHKQEIKGNHAVSVKSSRF